MLRSPSPLSKMLVSRMHGKTGGDTAPTHAPCQTRCTHFRASRRTTSRRLRIIVGRPGGILESARRPHCTDSLQNSVLVLRARGELALEKPRSSKKSSVTTQTIRQTTRIPACSGCTPPRACCAEQLLAGARKSSLAGLEVLPLACQRADSRRNRFAKRWSIRERGPAEYLTGQRRSLPATVDRCGEPLRRSE
jgi:hypothetical protein